MFVTPGKAPSFPCSRERSILAILKSGKIAQVRLSPLFLFRRRDRRSPTVNECVEDCSTAVAFLQNVRTGIAERLARKSAPPTAHSDIVHRADIANHRVAVLRDVLTNFRRCLIDRRNADQATTRVYPYAILRISIAYHGFALHWIELDENLIEVVAHQFCNCHLLSLVSLCRCNEHQI